MTDDIVTRLRKVPEKIIRMSGSEMNPYYNRCQDAVDEIERLRSLIKNFAFACKIDGFGHVYDVDFGDLTQAYKDSKEVIK